MPPTVNTYRTHAPKSNPHPDPRGVAIDAPYDETFIYQLKQLPDWCYEWRGREKVWVVDAAVWPWVKTLLKEHY